MQQKHSKLVKRKLLRKLQTKDKGTLCKTLSTSKANQRKLALNLLTPRELQEICHKSLLGMAQTVQKIVMRRLI